MSDPTNGLLGTALSAAVPLRIMEMAALGGPTDSDFERIRGFADALAEKGDILQFRSKKKGETAELFNRLADALCVMSFVPGGVRFGADRYEAKPKASKAIDESVPHVMVAGTRSFADFDLFRERMDRYAADLGSMVVCIGEWRRIGCGTPNHRGVDLLAEQWAHRVRKCPVRQFPPEFDKFPNTAAGRAGAFHKRNRDMVEFVAGCENGFAVVFWDGVSPGTASVIELLRKRNVAHKIVRYEESG